MALYNEQLDKKSVLDHKSTRAYARWRKWAKNQHNRLARRNKQDCKMYKFFKYWEI